MRASLVLSLACLSLLAVVVAVSATGDLGSDIEWIEPSFVESEATSLLPGVGGACGAGGRCVANGGACARPANTIVWSLCTVPAMCCVPAKAAAGASSSAATTPAAAAGVWQAVRDPKTGRTYWYNSATKATTWTNPNNAAPAAPAPAPAKPAAPAAAPASSGSSAQGTVAAPAGGPVAMRPATITIPASLLALGAQWTRAPKAAPVSNACPKSAPLMPDAVLTQILTGLWQAFGATPTQATTYAAANLKQIHRESTGCPNIKQGVADVNSRAGNPAGGLVQFIDTTFVFWHVKGTPLDKFNPVANLAAAINAQVNSQTMSPACQANRVLNGCGYWAPGKGVNPYAG